MSSSSGWIENCFAKGAPRGISRRRSMLSAAGSPNGCDRNTKRRSVLSDDTGRGQRESSEEQDDNDSKPTLEVERDIFPKQTRKHYAPSARSSIGVDVRLNSWVGRIVGAPLIDRSDDVRAGKDIDDDRGEAI